MEIARNLPCSECIPILSESFKGVSCKVCRWKKKRGKSSRTSEQQIKLVQWSNKYCQFTLNDGIHGTEYKFMKLYFKIGACQIQGGNMNRVLSLFMYRKWWHQHQPIYICMVASNIPNLLFVCDFYTFWTTVFQIKIFLVWKLNWKSYSSIDWVWKWFIEIWHWLCKLADKLMNVLQSRKTPFRISTKLFQ